PLLELTAGDVAQIELGPPSVGARPAITLTLHSAGNAAMRRALRAARSFRLVLVNARGELILDTEVSFEMPGPRYLLSTNAPAQMLRARLGQADGQPLP